MRAERKAERGSRDERGEKKRERKREREKIGRGVCGCVGVGGGEWREKNRDMTFCLVVHPSENNAGKKERARAREC